MVLKVTEFNSIFNMPNSNYKAARVHDEQNSVFNRLKEDIDRLETRTNQTKEHSHTDQALLYALSPLPPARRIGSLPDTMEEKNYPRAGLLLGMAAANFPGDLREMGLAFREGKNIFANGLSTISKNEYQHPLSFFRRTIFEPITKKIPWLNNIDKTLHETSFGKFIEKKLLKIDVIGRKQIEGVGSKAITGYKFSGNFFSKLAGRALLRVPILGIAAGVVLETPAIINSVTKTKGNVLEKSKVLGKQLLKSGGYIGLMTAWLGIAGALLFPYGYIAALIGTGIGGSLALMASKKLNNQIDKLII